MLKLGIRWFMNMPRFMGLMEEYIKGWEGNGSDAAVMPDEYCVRGAGMALAVVLVSEVVDVEVEGVCLRSSMLVVSPRP